MEKEGSNLKDRCETKVSKVVEDVEKEFSRAIGNVIQQFAGVCVRERERE